MDPVTEVPRAVRWSTFLRSFAIQGSWNYRTMLGQGFAFAILPVLRHVHAGDREGLERALERHSGHFNAHPYLAELALGAVARMEAEGRDPATIRRFKEAVRGPLGGLGDRLVWVGVLPTAALAALLLAAAGAPSWLPPVFFLLAYNGIHLALRLWAYRTGLERGAAVGDRLRSLPLGRLADRITGVATFLLGSLLGMVAVRAAEGDPGVTAALGLLAAGASVTLGVRWGPDSWRRAAGLAVLLVTVGIAVGFWI